MPSNDLMDLFSNASIASMLNKGSEGDYVSRSKMKGEFAQKITKWADEVMNKYYTYGIDVNDSISKIASANNLTDEQINRIIEETNQEVYLTEYNKMKECSDRDVRFKIASLNEIRGKMDLAPAQDQSIANKMASHFSNEEFVKEASEKVSMYDFMTKGTFATTALSEERPIELKDILVEKIAKETDDTNRDVQKEADSYMEETCEFGDALLKYATYGYDMQDLFNNVCKKGDIRKSVQSPMIKCIVKQAETLIQNKAFPSNINYNISMVDTIEKEAAVSLGKHSLNSNNSNNSLPKILINDKKIISDVRDLVNMASNIQVRHEVLKKKIEKQQNLLKKIASFNEA